MTEDAFDDLDIANDLLDLIPRLLQQLRVNLPDDAEQERPEWHDINELRATNGQIRLLRILNTQQRSMQELADLLGVAAPTVTAMVKRLLAQGYIERSRDDADWRAVWIKPTPRGRQVVAIFQQARLASLQHRLEQLTTEERESILAALPALHRLADVAQRITS